MFTESDIWNEYTLKQSCWLSKNNPFPSGFNVFIKVYQVKQSQVGSIDFGIFIRRCLDMSYNGMWAERVHVSPSPRYPRNMSSFAVSGREGTRLCPSLLTLTCPPLTSVAKQVHASPPTRILQRDPGYLQPPTLSLAGFLTQTNGWKWFAVGRDMDNRVSKMECFVLPLKCGALGQLTKQTNMLETEDKYFNFPRVNILYKMNASAYCCQEWRRGNLSVN